MLATEATLLKTAINTGIAAFGKDGGSKANSLFQKLVNSLIPGGTPEPAKKKKADPAMKGRVIDDQ